METTSAQPQVNLSLTWVCCAVILWNFSLWSRSAVISNLFSFEQIFILYEPVSVSVQWNKTNRRVHEQRPMRSESLKCRLCLALLHTHRETAPENVFPWSACCQGVLLALHHSHSAAQPAPYHWAPDMLDLQASCLDLGGALWRQSKDDCLTSWNLLKFTQSVHVCEQLLEINLYSITALYNTCCLTPRMSIHASDSALHRHYTGFVGSYKKQNKMV